MTSGVLVRRSEVVVGLSVEVAVGGDVGGVEGAGAGAGAGSAGAIPLSGGTPRVEG